MYRNLLKNPNGDEDLKFWELTKNGGNGWKVEDMPGDCGHDFVNDKVSKYFATSHTLCLKRQVINLLKEGYSAEDLDGQPQVKVSDWYCGRRDCSSTYQITVTLLDKNQELIQKFTPEPVTLCPKRNDCSWREISHSFTKYGRGLRFISFEHGGKDCQFWAGWYGVRVTSSSVTIELAGYDNDWKYNLDLPSMGVCIIINNKTFKVPRAGSDKDAAAAKKTFTDLGYKVTVYNDLTEKQMKTVMKDVADQNHSQNASFVCVILSHGSEGRICGTDGSTTLKSLTKPFKGDQSNQSLIGKPKLFFIEACRVLNKNPRKEEEVVEEAVEHSCGPHNIPVDADFLFAYATDPGHYAWRDKTNGSWFIQSLCEMISKHKDLELLHIMTRVNRKVAFEFQTHNSKDPKLDGLKEIPCFTSMLTKDFYFSKKP
ncbi:unnamed protein product [Knipowitschia caucasica]